VLSQGTRSRYEQGNSWRTAWRVPSIDPHLDSRTTQQPRSPALIAPHVQRHRARRRGSSTTAVLDSVWDMAVPVLAYRRGDHDNHPGASGSEGYLWGCDLGVLGALGPWKVGTLARYPGRCWSLVRSSIPSTRCCGDAKRRTPQLPKRRNTTLDDMDGGTGPSLAGAPVRPT